MANINFLREAFENHPLTDIHTDKKTDMTDY